VILAGALACAVAVWLVAVAVLAPSPPRVSWSHPERERLRDAGWPWSPARWEGMRLAGATLAAIIAAAVGMDPAIGTAMGAVVPSLALRARSDRRREGAAHLGLDQLRAIRAGLASGASLVESIQRSVAAITDPIAARPFRLVVRQFAVGLPLSDALRGGAAQADPRLRPALRTLAIGVEERLPVPQLAALADAVIERLTFDEQIETEVRARTSGVRIQIWAMAAIVPGLALYLAATVPLVAETLRSPLGTHLLIPAAVALELIGVMVARRAVRDIA
jgi:Flp pilus assembly protein TadB